MHITLFAAKLQLFRNICKYLHKYHKKAETKISCFSLFDSRTEIVEICHSAKYFVLILHFFQKMFGQSKKKQ